ncbi:hypothetical protein R6Q59_005615 [Mikania micrantha]|uniref:Uncharacterized protein n=1 Tax=Mikania micrantha TaxID=192012 RepID=A0A5N6Q3P6_9ASTR|nr:hypothetical protein E3N88_01773 [Mikania micrantha]
MARFEEINQSNKLPPISACEQSRSAFVDLIILIAVIGACGFLILEPVMDLMLKFKQDVVRCPMVYCLIGLAIVTIAMAKLAISLCKSRKCGQPGCRGLRKAVEFDIQIETNDSIKNYDSLKNGFKKGLFELPKDYLKELEAALKKMAPANGRVVLVFRGRCGCPVVRVEVPGPRKSTRKVKK